MKSPKDQATIQIEITNACQHSCSNCTRFCGHHKKPYFMDFDTFKRAVDSMEGYEGTIGMMGGEPTLHPEFARFTEYLQSRIPKENRKTVNNYIYPQRDFMRSLRNQELENIVPIDYATGRREAVKGAGLWSAMVPNFMKNYELIQDVYRKEVLNDHNNKMLHQPALITRKELGISDEEWIKLREKCWINQSWSASITPKGCFFCEIAAALDRLFDGPGGWPIEPGWWKREEKDFEGQLHWCELCGIPLQTFTRDAREEVDDVSPVLYDMLKKVDSPKLKKGKVNLLEIKDGEIAEKSKASVHELRGEFYADSYYTRFDSEKSVLFPDGFNLLMICREDADMDELLYNTIHNAELVRQVIILCKESQKLDEKKMPKNISVVRGAFGILFNRVLGQMDWSEYLIVSTDNVRLSSEGIKTLSNCVINPGTLHYVDYENAADYGNEYIENADVLRKGYAALLNKNAQSLKSFGFDRIAHAKDFLAIKDMWQKSKVVEFSPLMDYMPPENEYKEGLRYALFGSGHDAGVVSEMILQKKDTKIVCVVDSNEKKQGTEFCGCIVERPEALLERRTEFDQIVLASTLYYAEMKKKVYEFGFKDSDITML